MLRCIQAFDLSGQTGQPFKQHRFFVMAGTANRLGQVGQFLLGLRQRRRGTACHWQAQQGHHAVSLYFKQPLHHATQTTLRQLTHPQQHARVTIWANLKIGMHGG